jgi:acylphosphatase
MSERMAVRMLVHGRVQGVYFRQYTVNHGRELGLKGYAKNMPDGTTVEVYAEGERSALLNLIEFVQTGSPRARVDSIEVEWVKAEGRSVDFTQAY